MKLSRRVTRFIFVSLGLIGLVFALAFWALVIILGSAVAFSGSTGSAWSSFLDRLAPAAYFMAGAVVTGAFVAIANAVATTQGMWVKTVIASSAVGGLFTVLNPSIARLLLQLSNPVMSLLGKVFLNR